MELFNNAASATLAHDAIAAELISRFDGVEQPNGDVYCRCPFCDWPAEEWPYAVYQRAVGIFRCGHCNAECDAATLATAPAVRAAWAVWTPARVGALAVKLWEKWALRPDVSYAIPDELDVHCDACPREPGQPTAQLRMRGIQRGSIFCQECRTTIDAATVLDRYQLTLADLDALIVPADRIVRALRQRGVLPPDTSPAFVRSACSALNGYSLPCQFQQANCEDHDEHNSVTGTVIPLRAWINADLGVYWCAGCDPDDRDAAHHGAFGTLGQLADYLRLDLRPDEAGTTAEHAHD